MAANHRLELANAGAQRRIGELELALAGTGIVKRVTSEQNPPPGRLPNGGLVEPTTSQPGE